MDIYEKIKMFTKPKFDKDEDMATLISHWKNYNDKIETDLHSFRLSIDEKKIK